MVLFESRTFNATSSAVDEFDLWPRFIRQQLVGYAGLMAAHSPREPWAPAGAAQHSAA